jgi:ParB/RepB/Spo0J family partition protein
MSEPLPLREFDPADCLPADDNRPAADRPGIDHLAQSIRDNGQLVPGLVCPHPEHAGKKLILDGVGRWHCCGLLARKYRALLLPGPVSEPERIKLRLLTNAIRRNMAPQEIADEAARYMKLTGCTQGEAAQQLNLSPASLSRFMTRSRRLPPELKDKADQVCPSVASLIAALPTPAAMQEALDFAAAPGPDGRLPTRDQVTRFAERYRPKRPRGPKGKSLKGRIDGRRVELSILPGESTDGLVEFLKALAATLAKHKHIPPDSLGFLFGGG